MANTLTDYPPTNVTLEGGSSDLDELAKALVAFQAEMPTVAKKHKANTGQFSYTYADLADVVESAAPILTRHGLAFVTLPGAGQLRGILLHTSGQWLSGALPLAGGNPQQVGSSLTYMRRYLLGAMTGIVTDDDDDGRLAAQQHHQAQQRQRPPSTPSNQPETPAKPMTTAQRAKMFALFGEKGIAEDQQLSGINAICGTAYASRGDLTAADAAQVIDRLEAMPSVEVPLHDPETGEVLA